MKDALGNNIKHGDRLIASDAYNKHIRENNPNSWSNGTKDELPANFVVAKIKHGPFWDPNAKGYRDGGYIEDDVAFDKDDVGFRSWQVQKVAGDTEPKKKKGWW